MNILNGRAFGIIRTALFGVLNILNARAFRTFTTQRNALNITNARAFRAKSGHGPDVLNITNARPFAIFRAS